MIGKAEFQHLKTRIKKLEDAIWEYENKNEIYLKYQNYQAMTLDDQVKLQSDWNKYYKQVDESLLGEGLRIAVRALKREQIDIVKECAVRVDNYTDTVPKPRLEDPEFMEYKLQGYRITKSNLERMKALYEEMLPVYGSREDKEGAL